MALSDDDWHGMITSVEPDRPTLHVETFHELYPESASQAVRVTCSDGEQYVIKGTNAGRVPYNEQVIAHLGRLLDAPIPPTVIAELSQELQEAESGLALLAPGMVHASRLEPDCADRKAAIYQDEAENRERIAALALLYTWMRASDPQVLYRKQSPRLIFSVDHGNFFAGGPNWTVQTLQQPYPVYNFDGFFVTISRHQGILEQKFVLLASITPQQIARAVARPPAEWGVTLEERVALCRYLDERRSKVLLLRRS